MKNKLELIADSKSEAYNCTIVCIGKDEYILDTNGEYYGPFSSILISVGGKLLIGEYNNNEVYHLVLKGKYEGKFDNSTIEAMMFRIVEELAEDIEGRCRGENINGISIDLELYGQEYPEWSGSIRIRVFIGQRNNSQCQTLEGLYDTKAREWAVKLGKHSIHYRDNLEHIEIEGANYKQCIGKDYKSLVVGEYTHVDVLGKNIYFVGDGVREHGGKVIYSDKVTDTIIYEVDTLSRIEVGKYILLSDGKKEVSLIESKAEILISSKLYYEGAYLIVGGSIIEIFENTMVIHNSDGAITNLEDVQIGMSWGSIKALSFEGRLYDVVDLGLGIYYAIDYEISRQWEALEG